VRQGCTSTTDRFDQGMFGAGSSMSDLCRSRVACVESHGVAGVRAAGTEEAEELGRR
jgi:hypothetical protein